MTVNKTMTTYDISLPSNSDNEIAQLKEELNLYSRQGKKLAEQIQAYKNKTALKLLNLIRPHKQSKHNLPKDIHPLYDYLIQNFPNLGFYHLNESVDLSVEPKQTEYLIKVSTQPVKQIILSFAIDFFPKSGFIRLELLTQSNKLIAWSSKSVLQIEPYAAAIFDLNYEDTASIDQQEIILKISTDNCDLPVRIRECNDLIFSNAKYSNCLL